MEKKHIVQSNLSNEEPKDGVHSQSTRITQGYEDPWDDKQFVLKKVSHFGLELSKASKRLRSDPQVVAQALRSNALSYLSIVPGDASESKEVWEALSECAFINIDQLVENQVISARIGSEREIMCKSIHNGSKVLKCIDPKLLSDPEVALCILKNNSLNVDVLDPKVLENEQVAWQLISSGYRMGYRLSRKWRLDKKMMLQAVKSQESNLTDVLEPLCFDPQIIEVALKKNALSYKYLPAVVAEYVEQQQEKLKMQKGTWELIRTTEDQLRQWVHEGIAYYQSVQQQKQLDEQIEKKEQTLQERAKVARRM